jgi:hypothetical protein
VLHLMPVPRYLVSEHSGTFCGRPPGPDTCLGGFLVPPQIENVSTKRCSEEKGTLKLEGKLRGKTRKIINANSTANH